MKKLTTIFTTLFITLNLYAMAIGQSVTPSTSKESINEIAAVVNNNVITNDDLNQQVTMVMQQMRAEGVAMPSMTVLRQQVLQQMITEELQLQQAKRLKIKVTKTELQSAISKVAAANHLTPDELYAHAEAVGFTRDGFDKQIKREILIQKVQSAVLSSRVSLSQEEVNDYLNILKKNPQTISEYHLADILIALPDSPTTDQVMQANTTAKQVVKELQQGADFQKVAMSVSGGAQALQGGDLGWRKLAELPTPFVPYAKDMQVNQVAGPIRTPNGFHVIKLLGERTTSGLSSNPEDQRKQVEQMLYERQFNEALTNWIAQLKSEAYIKVNN